MTIQDFIGKHGISLTARPADSNPNLADPLPGGHHWLCTLGRPSVRPFTVFFSQGSARTAPPTADDVLDCLAADSSGVEGLSFDEWARGFGYDPDSRKAERIYKVCQRQAKRLRHFLGEKAYLVLLNEVERLWVCWGNGS